MTVDEEVAAAIQIIDDGNGGFTMKNEGDTANPVPVAIGVHGYKSKCAIRQCGRILIDMFFISFVFVHSHRSRWVGQEDAGSAES